ncbi:MAG: GMC family oxidoreductase [Acidobacteria bacterium]|nr:GMC family oxidoreductase [Acidobacteriota bacterium]
MTLPASQPSTSTYDVLIIGTGAGGGTLALQLARAGKRILILERGSFLPQEKLNWDTSAVFLENRYHTTDVWQDTSGKDLHPQQAYFVGGQTKVYGAAMFRLRAEDFGVLHHKGGISPAWPLTYADFEPYYTRAEELFDVHGALSPDPTHTGYSVFDPTEPFHSKPYPYPNLPDEPRMAAIHADVSKLGYHPFPVPLGLKRNSADPVVSKCIRCDTCDGYPCLVHAKSDVDINCIRQIQHLPNVTLMTHSRALRLITNAMGTEVTGVEVQHDRVAITGKGTSETPQQPELATYSADIIAVCCGAINSAALLLQSATDRHPNGLANSSGQVGRNFMMHAADAILSLSFQRNQDSYMKTWGSNDFYFRDPNGEYDFPMGSVQPIGSFHHEMMKEDAPPLTPGFVLETMRDHAVPWWLMTEDLPLPENRVQIIRGTDGRPQIKLSYTDNNTESFNRLKSRWIDVLKQAGHAESSIPFHAYFKKRIPLNGVGHQNGTCRFGTDPGQSVLDLNCKTHDLANLYIVDASFFPSCGAVNPSLTIIANAIRVADHLLETR